MSHKVNLKAINRHT